MKKKVTSILIVILMTVIGFGVITPLVTETASAMTRDEAVNLSLSGNTKNGYIYRDGVKYGKYMFVPVGNYLYKVNLRKNKKQTFCKVSKKKNQIITFLSIHDKHVYFLKHTAQWNDPNNPSWLCCKKINGKKIVKICRSDQYKFVGNTLYSQYTKNDAYNPDNSITYCTTRNTKDWSIITTISYKGAESPAFVNAVYKNFNVKKYKLKTKLNFNTATPYVKYWLKKPNGKKIYLGKHDYF